MKKTEKTWNVYHKKNICYDIKKSVDLFDPNNEAILAGGKKNSGKRFVVLDSFIFDRYHQVIETFFESRGINFRLYRFTAGDENKNFDSFIKILNELNEFQIDRKSEPIIAIGGGVTTDIVGFVASLFRRGVPHIKVPTTLMGYVDASVGIKTGINFGGGKNRVGTFEPPKCVVLDKTFLETNDQRNLINGLGEIVKLSVVNDEKVMKLLELYGKDALEKKFQTSASEEILDLSISIMLKELSPNLYEDNLDRSVDFGHTFSPTLEMITNDSLMHGEAVAIDVFFSSILAYKKGLLLKSDLDRLFILMKGLGTPYISKDMKVDVLWDAVEERTYHRDGKQRIPLPKGFGNCTFINDLKKTELMKASEFMNNYVGEMDD